MNFPRRRDGSGVAAVIAAFVGLLALCVSGYTAYLQRQQVRAQVWPYIEFGSSNSRHELDVIEQGRRSGDHPHGAGLRRRQAAAQLEAGLRRARDSSSNTRRCFRRSTASSFPPANTSARSLFADEADFNTFVTQAKRIDMSLCYCSTLGECWLIDDREKDRALRFREINTCPAESADDFIDNNTAEAAPAAKQEDK